MSIDFKKASAAIEKQTLLAKDKNATKIIQEFLFDKCHYFTAIISEHIRSESVTLFYFSISGRIVHSAVTINENQVLDAIGRRSCSEIESTFDAISASTGQYHKQGRCDSYTLSLANFDPDLFYTEPLIISNDFKQKAIEWLREIQ